MHTTRSTSAADHSTPLSGWPARRTLGILVLLVLLAHLGVLLSLSGTLALRLPTDDNWRTTPLQTRWVPPPAPKTNTPAAPSGPARTRIATETVATPLPAEPEPQPEPTATASHETPRPAEVVPPAHEPAANGPAPAPDAGVASTPTPLTPLGALPASTLLSYRLTGQAKKLTYHATGELRWQSNASDYAMNLSIKAFLLGTRHWRSVGKVTATGLAPTRFSDSWRNERATHFDRGTQRVVFSSNAPAAPLETGAQDQISLYVQLAAAMAGEPQRFQPGTRLQIQTATVKDALPWLLTLDGTETLNLENTPLPTIKWVCQPRNRFDAKVEFWVTEKLSWLPVRIRITQVNGDFIDLSLSGQEPLPDLPMSHSEDGKTTPS